MRINCGYYSVAVSHGSEINMRTVCDLGTLFDSGFSGSGAGGDLSVSYCDGFVI